MDHLYFFIQTLTPTERGYFQRWSKIHSASRKSAYLQLFDFYCQPNLYHKDREKKKDFPIEGNELANLRRTLLKNLLKCLQSYHGGLSPEAIAREELNRAEILYIKERFILCNRQIRSALRKARKSECWLETLQLLNLQIRLLRKLDIPEANRLKLIREAYAEKKGITATVENLDSYKHLFDEVFAFLTSRGTQAPQRLEAWAGHTLLQSPEGALSREAKLFFHIIHATLSSLQGRPGEGLDHYRKNVEIWKDSKDYQKGRELNFMVALVGQLDRLARYGELEEFRSLLDYLENIRVSSSFAELTREFYVAFESINYYVSLGDKELFGKKMLEFERFIVEKGQFFQNSKKVPYLFNLFSGFFHLQDWAKALDWLYYIERETQGSEKRLDIHASLDILQLLCQFLLDSGALDSRLASVENRLRKKRKQGGGRTLQFRFDDLLFRMIRALHREVRDTARKKAIFQNFKDEIETLGRESGRKPNGFIEVRAWFDSSLVGEDIWEFRGSR